MRKLNLPDETALGEYARARSLGREEDDTPT
jgi:hypothetical protein